MKNLLFSIALFSLVSNLHAYRAECKVDNLTFSIVVENKILTTYMPHKTYVEYYRGKMYGEYEYGPYGSTDERDNMTILGSFKNGKFTYTGQSYGDIFHGTCILN